jgi:murein L,D-transpeptidase YcbB/YkuD
LVYVALSLYQSSGTRQLDLSRPGYDSARKEASKDAQVFQGFSADGPIDAKSLATFDTLYKQKAAEALIELDAFSGDSLSDKTLQLQ